MAIKLYIKCQWCQRSSFYVTLHWYYKNNPINSSSSKLVRKAVLHRSLVSVVAAILDLCKLVHSCSASTWVSCILDKVPPCLMTIFHPKCKFFSVWGASPNPHCEQLKYRVWDKRKTVFTDTVNKKCLRLSAGHQVVLCYWVYGQYFEKINQTQYLTARFTQKRPHDCRTRYLFSTSTAQTHHVFDKRLMQGCVLDTKYITCRTKCPKLIVIPVHIETCYPTTYRWFSVRPSYVQCVCNEDTAVLY